MTTPLLRRAVRQSIVLEGHLLSKEELLQNHTMRPDELKNAWRRYFLKHSFGKIKAFNFKNCSQITSQAGLLALINVLEEVRITRLDLSGAFFDGEIARVFFESLNQIQTLQRVLFTLEQCQWIPLDSPFLDQLQVFSVVSEQPRDLSALRELVPYLLRKGNLKKLILNNLTLKDSDLEEMFLKIHRTKTTSRGALWQKVKDLTRMSSTNESVTSLSLEGNEITNKGLWIVRGNFSDLTSLNLKGNRINAVDWISNFPNIFNFREINLQNNEVSEKEFQNFINLLERYREEHVFLFNFFPQRGENYNFQLIRRAEKVMTTHGVRFNHYLPNSAQMNNSRANVIAMEKSIDQAFVDRVSRWIEEEDHPDLKELYLKKLLSHFYEIFNPKADGQCLFRSIGKFVNEEDPQKVREIAVHKLLENREFFDVFFSEEKTLDAHCQEMLEPSTWGDQYELTALSMHYQRPIYIFRVGYKNVLKQGRLFPTGLPIGEDFQEKPIFLLHSNNNHYMALLQ
jgi:hypothetical protein